jgi:biopolymer transport protein ExbD
MAYKPQAGAQMAAPNVIPMADIMLVLLIIFMVVTPMLQKTHQVDMATVNNAREKLSHACKVQHICETVNGSLEQISFERCVFG